MVTAVESFVGRFGAELTRAQAEMKPSAFARMIEQCGISRAKADQFMSVARLQSSEIPEVRPSAWHVLFRALEPLLTLPGETDPIIDYAEAVAEPTPLSRRLDLLSADGLVHLLAALHEPEAMSPGSIEVLAAWLAGESDRSEVVAELRSWRTTFGEAGNPADERGIQVG